METETAIRPGCCEFCGCECREREGALCTPEPMHPDSWACSACDCECCLDDGCEDEDD